MEPDVWKARSAKGHVDQRNHTALGFSVEETAILMRSEYEVSEKMQEPGLKERKQA